MKENYIDILEKHKILKSFFDKLEYISFVSNLMLKETGKSLSKNHPYIIDAMYGDRKNLTKIVKVLSYDYNKDELCTSPHHDKSVMSLILKNDDKIDNRIVLSTFQDKDDFDFKKLKPLEKKFNGGKTHSSAILLPGGLPKHVGISILPTPHAVFTARFFKQTFYCRFCINPKREFL